MRMGSLLQTSYGCIGCMRPLMRMRGQADLHNHNLQSPCIQHSHCMHNLVLCAASLMLAVVCVKLSTHRDPVFIPCSCRCLSHNHSAVGSSTSTCSCWSAPSTQPQCPASCAAAQCLWAGMAGCMTATSTSSWRCLWAQLPVVHKATGRA